MNKRSDAKDFANKYLAFLKKATVPYTVVLTLEDELKEAGFEELKMEAIWKVSSNGKYYVKPYDTILIAFSVGKEMHQLNRFKIVGTHIDSPGFKLKPKADMKKNGYHRLNVERYGGVNNNTWLDRKLSLAGKVMLKSEDVFEPKKLFFDFSDTYLMIPNLAIHRNPKVNEGVELSVQKELLPILGQTDGDETFLSYLAEKLDVPETEILDYDINVYINEDGIISGRGDEFIMAPRQDNLSMAYTSIRSIIESESDHGINMAVCFDNEEVGSLSKQGAMSHLLGNVMERIFIAYDKEKEQYLRVLPHSFMISADGSYAVHPNRDDKNDPTNLCKMNGGLTIKISASKNYATDTETAAIFKQLCTSAGVETQEYVNHSDARGGKTIGSIVESFIGVKGVDVGPAMLAMHSAMEYVGVEDLYDAYQVFKHFYGM